MLTAVVGHVEWVSFARVPRLPSQGEIVHAEEFWDEVGGGGSVAAGQLAKLSDQVVFFTALGDDEVGLRSRAALGEMGIRVEAMTRPHPTRRAITHLDPDGERTITVLGERAAPLGSDPLPWDLLEQASAVYFTAGDAASLRAARTSGALVATARVLPLLQEAGVQLDAIVGSSEDSSERYRSGDLVPEPHLAVITAGASGGTYLREGAQHRYQPASPPGPIEDRYGAGDSFAAGLTHGLGAGMSSADAVAFAARCGAHAITGRGPYSGQLRING